jgi:hypothetical protein
MRNSLFVSFLLFSSIVFAGEADVIDAKVEHSGGDFYRFIVTVQHDDEGWEHFAKAWEVLDVNGNILGARVLLHPHVNEQPFTRTQTISLPENINQVTIRAYDLVHEFGGKELTLDIKKGN